MRRTPLLALAAALASAGLLTAPMALAQDPPEDTTTSSTTTTVVAPPPTDVTVPVPPGETTTTTTVPPADDPGAGEELPTEPVPVVPDTVPPRPADGSAYAADASRLIRRELRVAEAEAVQLETAYAEAKDRVVALEAELDELELAVTSLADDERAAVRRVEVARRAFEARAANAIVRGGLDSFTRYIVTDDPNEIAVANTLLDSVLAADQESVAEYLAAKADVDADLVRTAERLVDAWDPLESTCRHASLSIL